MELASRNPHRDGEIIRLYLSGLPYLDIASQVGIDTSLDKKAAINLLACVIRKAGISNRPRGRPVKPRESIVGRVFGELTVLCEAGKDHKGNRLVKVQCSCGKVKTVYVRNVENGQSRGCFHSQRKPGERRKKATFNGEAA